jgi:hypothetical protein
MADSADHMPIEVMQLLQQRSPGTASLWAPDLASSEELWLMATAGYTSSHTMAQVLLSLIGAHIAFCDDHVFQTEVQRNSVEALFEKMLLCLTDFISLPSPILPMEVEEGSILVHPTGASWAIALSRQH